MKTKRSGIYRVRHVESGRVYVGQSIHIDQRLQEHASGHTGTGKLSNAIAKYGWAAFDYDVLELCAPERLNAAEVEWIAKLGSLHPAGFNLTTGGQRWSFTDEVRKRISEKTREFMTPEWCARRAAKLRGVPKSPEHRAKIGAAHTNPINIARITEMARNQSAETREKIAAAHRGKKLSEETRVKISAAKQGSTRAPWTPEQRVKMSEAMRAGWARRQTRLAGAST